MRVCFGLQALFYQSYFLNIWGRCTFLHNRKDIVKDCVDAVLHPSDGWWLSLCFSLLFLLLSPLVNVLCSLFLPCVLIWVCVKLWLVFSNCWLLLNRSSASCSTRWKSHWNLQLRNTAPNERLSISFICFTQPGRWKRCMRVHVTAWIKWICKRKRTMRVQKNQKVGECIAFIV